MYTTPEHWYSHHQPWLTVAVVLSAASISVALFARRA
jgi:hypothetical protein